MLEIGYGVSGFVVGLIVGMTGVGGGALMTPLLVLLFGIQPALAIGTDLWFAAITKAVGGRIHSKKGSIDWQVFRRLSLGSLPAALLTLGLMHTDVISKTNNPFLLKALGAVVLVTAIAMIFKRYLHSKATQMRVEKAAVFLRLQAPATVIAGAILGVLVTLTSIGAGALGAVMLIYLYPFRMKPAKLAGTDIMHAVPLTVVAGTGHLYMGNVDFQLLGNLLAGSVPGIVVGALLTDRMDERYLRIAISTLLVVAGLKMVAN